jgi:hypothetical protein
MGMRLGWGAAAILAGIGMVGTGHADDDLPDWVLVAAMDEAVASLWLVPQSSAKPPVVRMEEHLEFDETHERRGIAFRRFTDFNCSTGTIERGVSSAYEPESESSSRIDSLLLDVQGIGRPPADDAPVRPQPGTYEERVFQMACAFAAGDPQFRTLPRLDRPFFRADAERVIAELDPAYTRRTYQGFAVSIASSGVYGVAAVKGEPSYSAADTRLKAQCTAKGWQCETIASPQCVALASTRSPIAYFPGLATTADAAKAEAQAACREAGETCDIVDVRCP